MYYIESIIMLSISVALGIWIFCIGSMSLFRSKKFRDWAVKLTMKWCNDLTTSIMSDEKEEP